jgi:hypothetical protein
MRTFVQRWGVTGLLLLCVLALIGWNAHRFAGAEARIRAKDLDFLPAPEVAAMLALGHRNTVAKLRWIDSFAYFQYQLDHKDDRVAGGGAGGFQRLYETLIYLDPHFLPFYDHAALTTGALMGQHRQCLAFLMRGLLEVPDRTELWRSAATELRQGFHWEEQEPRLFAIFLGEWAEHETTLEGKVGVWEWQRAMAHRSLRGLEQLPIWFEQLKTAKPGTPAGDYLESLIRQQLASFGKRELEALRAAYRLAQGAAAERLTDLWENAALIDPLAPYHPREITLKRLEDLLSPRLLRHRYPQGLPRFGPIAVQGDRLVLRPDPWGHQWLLDAKERVVSPGLEQLHFRQRLGQLNGRLVEVARVQGRWPTSPSEIQAAGIALPEPPFGGRLALEGQALTVIWPPPASPPWPLR